MKRRSFLQSSATSSLGILLSTYACNPLQETEAIEISAYETLATELLTVWCEGLLDLQIVQAEDPTIHGALACPACNKIHGRCMDAVYPFLYMADKTGEKKYMEAAVLLMEWSKNVSMPDGSWTVIPDPKSWRGITVFGAIALAEALHHHGHILPKEVKEAWLSRLGKAGEYIYQRFDMVFTNINYGFTAVYALNLLGRVLDRQEYLDRSRVLAQEMKNWFTEPNTLLFGEAKPSNKRSAKGLLGVDLGYNVEESLNGVVQYALVEKDEELLALLSQSLGGHLAFMLPDGGWDNSWGTRQYKWSYWGSRTTDGCQPAFGLMADRNPAFGTAAYLNTELLRNCTSDGLLYGGLHYESHGIKPCVHHTFTHTKALTTLLDAGKSISAISKTTPLPRTLADGIREFPEVAVHLAARGDFRATVSTYDFIYKEKAQQGSGGSICMLYHMKLGPLLAASMAKYLLVERNNQQPNPDNEDFALTPRLESFQNGEWYTNLYDLEASVEATDHQGIIRFEVLTKLVNQDQKSPKGKELAFQLNYLLEKETLSITAKPKDKSKHQLPSRFVLPIISPTGEKVSQTHPNQIEIHKPNGIVRIEANASMKIKQTAKERVFNMVPGAEAVPIEIGFPDDVKEGIVCTIKIVL